MYRLHGIYDWGSLAVHMALAELSAPYEFVTLDRAAKDMSSPAYLAMNPFGLLPVLETPDGPLFETAAILLYLADRHSALAPAPTAPDRGVFLVWLSVLCQQLHPAVMQLLHPERLLGQTAARNVADAAHARTMMICAALNGRALQGDWWLSGTCPSIVAIDAAMLLRWAQAFALTRAHALRLGDYPALLQMVKALVSRPAIAQVLEREGLYAQGANPLSAAPYCQA